MQAALPLMIAGQLVQGIGALQAGNYAAKAAEVNAVGAEREGSAQGQAIRDAARAAMGQQVGAQAESGFAPGTGTALLSLRESAINAEMDVLETRRKAASQALAYRAQGAMEKQKGRMAMLGGLVGAASSIAGYKANYAQASASAGYPAPPSPTKS